MDDTDESFDATDNEERTRGRDLAESIGLTRRQILSALGIGGVGTFTGARTWGAFSDRESTTNTLVAGELPCFATG